MRNPPHHSPLLSFFKFLEWKHIQLHCLHIEGNGNTYVVGFQRGQSGSSGDPYMASEKDVGSSFSFVLKHFFCVRQAT